MAGEDLILLEDSSVAERGPADGNGASHKYYIWSIGCQMNKADSERLESALGQLGFGAAATPGEADVIVLNSCVVRDSAEQKVVGMLGLMKPLKHQRPDRILALMGCMVGPKTDDLKRRFPQVDVFIRPQQYKPLLDMLGERLGVDWEGCLGPLVSAQPSISAYVPVIHGCDLFCTFCIIPYRRGRQVSRPVPELLREVELLARRGAKEVTLLGQTVDAYGHDLEDRPDLADLLYAIHDIPGLERIRFLTSHPIFMTDRILEAVAGLPKVCEHMNLPFQAGDDALLERMRRRYTQQEYRRLVEKVRNRIPGIALSTDVIVGFCGETEEQFQQTVRLLQEVRFDKVHLAAYSPRPGTIAYRTMTDDVPGEEKRRRNEYLEGLQEQIATELNARLLGKRVEVLVEGQEKGKWRGRTRTDKLVFFENGAIDYLGKLVSVEVTKTSPWALQGSLVRNGER